MIYQISCPCLFGLESVLSDEIRAIGGENLSVSDGRVTFNGDAAMIAKANLWLRTAERVQLLVGSYHAETFEQLFDGMVKLPLERYVGKKDAFPIKGWSLNSTLASVPSCQSILKKAAVKRLEEKYRISWFEESGSMRQLQFAIMKDEVSIFVDTSGVGLHKRGYRPTSNDAPIKETLAAGILQLARISADTNLIDPFCGSGTFLVEGAMIAMNIAPGLRRSFTCEAWEDLEGENLSKHFSEERAKAVAAVNKDIAFTAYGYDIDPYAVQVAKDNAYRAGIADHIRIEERAVADFHTDLEKATIICNPPYGERLLEIQEAEEIYRTMGKVFEQRRFLNYYIISPHEDFEKLFGLGADKRRKLYNGMIRCQLFMYYKGGVPLGQKPSRPPRRDDRNDFRRDKDFKREFRKDGEPRREADFRRGDKPFRKDGEFRRDNFKRDDREFKPRSEGFEKREGFRKDGEFRRDNSKRDGDFKREGFQKREGGYNRDNNRRKDGEFKPRSDFKRSNDPRREGHMGKGRGVFGSSRDDRGHGRSPRKPEEK